MLLLVTNQNGQRFHVGADQIETITPYSGSDKTALEKGWSTIRLASGRELLVQETVDDIVDFVNLTDSSRVAIAV